MPRNEPFSPEERSRVLAVLLDALQSDKRIAGALIVGSGAEGFADNYSDIDLAVVVEQDDDLPIVFKDWGLRLGTVVDVFHSNCDAWRHLWVYLLDSFLEVDMGFVTLKTLSARAARWRVAFDRTGTIAETMERSWSERADVDLDASLGKCIDNVWYYVMHAAIAIQRGELWRARHEIELIRNQTIELHGLRASIDTHRFSSVHRLHRKFLDAMEEVSTSPDQPALLMAATRLATACFFREAGEMDMLLGSGISAPMKAKLQAYLDCFPPVAMSSQENTAP